MFVNFEAGALENQIKSKGARARLSALENQINIVALKHNGCNLCDICAISICGFWRSRTSILLSYRECLLAQGRYWETKGCFLFVSFHLRFVFFWPCYVV
jgi:hypothetical protein